MQGDIHHQEEQEVEEGGFRVIGNLIADDEAMTLSSTNLFTVYRES